MPKNNLNRSSSLSVITIEEARFWMKAMAEHAHFIEHVLKHQIEYVNEAAEFKQSFKSIAGRLEKFNGDKKTYSLLEGALSETIGFYQFKLHLLNKRLKNQINGCAEPSWYAHLADEAEYVIALFKYLGDIQEGDHLPRSQEMLFWIKVFADHSKLTRGGFDYTEKALYDIADDFSGEFDSYYIQGISHRGLTCRPTYANFIEDAKKEEYFKFDNPALLRLIHDVKGAVIRQRDFHKGLSKLVAERKALAYFEAMMYEHMYHEGEHYLALMAMYDKGTIKERPISNEIAPNKLFWPLEVEPSNVEVVDNNQEINEREKEAPTEVAVPKNSESSQTINEEKEISVESKQPNFARFYKPRQLGKT